jgi:hypothetical protein
MSLEKKLTSRDICDAVDKIKKITDEIEILNDLSWAKPISYNFLYLIEKKELLPKEIRIPLSIEKDLFDLINKLSEEQILTKKEELKKLTNYLNENL